MGTVPKRHSIVWWLVGTSSVTVFLLGLVLITAPEISAAQEIGDQDPSSHAESLVDAEEAGASVVEGVGDKRENSAQTAGSVSPSTGGRKHWWVGIITLLLLFVVALVITFARGVRPFDSEEVSSDAGTSQRDDQAERTGNVRSAREGGPPRKAVQQEAISVARQLVADFSDRAEAEGLLAVAYSRFGRAEEAEAAWKRSLTLDPEFAEAYDGLGKLELERGNYEPAVDYFRQALAAGDAVADVRPALAEALTNLQRVPEAVTVLEEQLQRVPADALSHFRLGQAYAMLREFDQARRCFEATLRIDPDNTYAYYGLSTTCRRLRDTKSADTYLQSFQRRKQEDLAAELKRVKTFDDQQQVLQGTSFIQKKAGSLYARLHNLRKAERVWVQAARLTPHDIEVRLQLASHYVQTQQFDQAAATFDELRQREPDNPDYCLQQGIIHAQRGRFVDAESAFQRAVQLRPEHAGSYAAFAQLYLRSGARLDEAQRLLQRAVQLDPDPRHFFLLSVACQQNGDLQGALRALQEAIRQEPQNVDYQRACDALRQQIERLSRDGPEPSSGGSR